VIGSEGSTEVVFPYSVRNNGWGAVKIRGP